MCGLVGWEGEIEGGGGGVRKFGRGKGEGDGGNGEKTGVKEWRVVWFLFFRFNKIKKKSILQLLMSEEIIDSVC